MTDSTAQDFTTQVEETGATTGEVVGEAVGSVVESAGDKAESVVDAVEGVVEESVDTVFPSEELPKTDDPYTEALEAEQAAETYSNVGVASDVEQTTLPQLDAETFSSQIFWLVVTFVLLYLLMAKSVLPRIHEVLEKRRHRIEHDLDQAERLAQEADESKADYERMHAESVARSQQMIADAETAIRQASDEEHEKLDAELSERMIIADKAIAKAAADVKKKLKPAAKSVAQQIVQAMTGSDAADKKVADIVAKAKW